MNPTFWKLSMGPGGSGEDFTTLFDVLDWVRRGVVLVHKDTRAKGGSAETQGELFLQPEREGDYFYLCHGNQEPSIILLGQFVGPPNYLCERGHGWIERPFRWIRTARLVKRYDGPGKWWTPNHNSTFIRVPTPELSMFESDILSPYFQFHLADFGVTLES